MTEFRRVTDETVLLKWRSEVLEHVFGSEPAADIIDANRTYYRRHVADRAIWLSLQFMTELKQVVEPYVSMKKCHRPIIPPDSARI